MRAGEVVTENINSSVTIIMIALNFLAVVVGKF